MTEIVVSAPGKVILHGEHSVVYGKVAVASSLNLRCFLRATASTDALIKLDLPDVGILKEWTVLTVQHNLQPHIESKNDEEGNPVPPSDACMQALREFAGFSSKTAETRDLAVISFLYLFCRICGKKDEIGELPTLHFRMLSQLPVGAGLGSSAAFSVCMASVLLQHAGLITPHTNSSASLGEDSRESACGWSDSDRRLINKWAFLGEKIIHGQPSGIDNSVSTFGGAIQYRNKQITQIKINPNIKILLTNTKVPRSTRTLVAGVRTKHDRFPEVISPVLQAMDGLAERSIHVYETMHSHGDADECYSKLEELVDMNQSLLNAIGVGHSSIDLLVSATIKHGLHTKLTGAGGGGCAYTLLRPETSSDVIVAVCRDLQAMGFECWETSVGAAGVIFHPNPQSDIFIPALLFSQ